MKDWIVPSYYVNHDLSSYLCNVSGPTVCDAPLRSCHYDPILTDDASINATQECGIDGMCYACLHKTLFPMIGLDVLLLFSLFVCGVLAGASGLGGGGLNVPILLLVSNFLRSEAVPLSQVMVMGSSIAQTLVNMQGRHPHSTLRAMIDLDVPLMLLPAQLVGNAIGVLLTPTLPATSVEILACVLLFCAATKTVLMAHMAFKQESNAPTALQRQELLLGSADHSCAAANGGGGGGGKREGLVVSRTRCVEVEHVATCPLDTPDASADAGGASRTFAPAAHLRGWSSTADVLLEAAELERIRAAYRRASVTKVVGLLLVWLSFLGLFFGSLLTKGTQCSAGKLAWLFALFIVPVGVVVLKAISLLNGDHGAGAGVVISGGGNAGAGEGRLPGDIAWTPRSVLLLPLLASLVGIVSGLLGLGGGELMAPLLLAIGMLPQVASATVGCMEIFTSTSNVAHYLVQGVLTPWTSYVYVLGGVGFLSAFTGRVIALTLVSRLSHPSLLAFVLAAALYTSLVFLGIQISYAPIDWSFGDLCT